MKKENILYIFILLIIFLSGVFLSFRTDLQSISQETEPEIQPETIPPEPLPDAEMILKINPGFEWALEPPKNIPAGENRAAVVYRPVHETVYCSMPLYVRAGPGSDFGILGRLAQGEVVRRGAVGNNGWSQILFKDKEAYVNSTYLSVTPILPVSDPFKNSGRATEDILCAPVTTKLRSGPGPDFAVVGHMTPGTRVSRVAEGDNGWSRILFHDTEVYAMTAGLKSDSVSLFYAERDEKVYALSDIGIYEKPDLRVAPFSALLRGESIKRIALGNNGWSQVLYLDQTAFIPTACLSVHSAPVAPPIYTQAPELPTPNAPFQYQYMAPENIMPHALFTPVDPEPGKSLPLIISLHGALEIGEAPETLKSNFITKELRNWEYTGLQSFDAYVVCPQMTGLGQAKTWRCPQSADNLFALIEYLKENYPIDENRIILEGHSLGGQGALYMAADERACFSAIVPISAYDPSVSLSGISARVRGYAGSPYIPAPREDWESFHFMNQIFSQFFGSENFHVKNCSHYDIPMVAFEEDLDGNGQSDLIEWMLTQ